MAPVAPPAVLSIEEARAMVEEMTRSGAWKKMDEIDREMESNPESYRELTTRHTFTPGLYMRSVLMERGHFISTRIHLTEHPFIVSAGRVLVWTEGDGVIEIAASHEGVTKPGTRRFIYVLEDCIWTTVHANPDNETDPDKIVDRCTYNNRELREKLP